MSGCPVFVFVRLAQGVVVLRGFLLPVTNHVQNPESLVRFFVTLALSSDPDIGIDTNIGVVDLCNSKFTFSMNGSIYQTSKCLYDDGAKGMCGRGTRAFEAYVDEEATALVIKDCWLEDREDRAPEHVMVAKVRSAMGQEEFRERFIDVRGHRVTRNIALDRVCEILRRGFNEHEGSHPVPLHWSRQPMQPKQPPRPVSGIRSGTRRRETHSITSHRFKRCT